VLWTRSVLPLDVRTFAKSLMLIYEIANSHSIVLLSHFTSANKSQLLSHPSSQSFSICSLNVSKKLSDTYGSVMSIMMRLMITEKIKINFINDYAVVMMCHSNSLSYTPINPNFLRISLMIVRVDRLTCGVFKFII